MTPRPGRLVVAIAVLVLCAGCGGTDDGEAAATASKSPEPRSLKATCDLMDGTLPATPELASDAKLVAFATKVQDYINEGDDDVKSALEGYLTAVPQMVAAKPGQQMLAASEAYDDQTSALADACKAAGSDAFQ